MRLVLQSILKGYRLWYKYFVILQILKYEVLATRPECTPPLAMTAGIGTSPPRDPELD